MYRLHIAIADLVLPAAEERATLPRLPQLEGLLARADRERAPADWRVWAARQLGAHVGEGSPAWARLLARQAGLPVDGWSWLVLTPVRLVAGLTTVNYDVAGPVALEETVARRTAAALEADFGDDDVVFRCHGSVMLMGLRGALAVRTVDPLGLAGRDLAEGVPTGADARRVARRIGEFELWLHGRAIEGVCGRRVNGFHPWGAGSAEVTPASASPRLLTPDPCLQAALGSVVDPGAAFAVWSLTDLIAGGQGFAQADTLWACALTARLRDGEVGAASLHWGAQVYAIRSAQRWRFFRRVRPWWEWLE
jgi:hypothetical protein